MVDTMAAVAATQSVEEPEPGTRVDVRSRYLGTWTHGFEVVERRPEGFVIRRLSDGSILPGVFDPEDVRVERKKQGLWWY
jgi:hypothetical protein